MKEFQCCGKLPRCTTYDRTLKTSDITLCKCFHRLFCFNGKQQNDCNHGTIEQNHVRQGACSRTYEVILVHRRRSVRFLAWQQWNTCFPPATKPFAAKIDVDLFIYRKARTQHSTKQTKLTSLYPQNSPSNSNYFFGITIISNWITDSPFCSVFAHQSRGSPWWSYYEPKTAHSCFNY